MIGIDPITKFGYDSLNFAKMFTLPINAKRQNFAFFDKIWLQSNLKSFKSSKLPNCDIFASLSCLVHVFFATCKDRVFTSLFFHLDNDCLYSQLQTRFRLATLPHCVNSSL